MEQSIEIPVDDIELVTDLYPRDGFDDDTVSRYRLSIDNLPPIKVTHENILVDGYHRLMAHKLENRDTIATLVRELPREAVLWEATKCNAGHGLQLSMTDKKRLARQFFTTGQAQTDIADVLSVDVSSISRWVRDLKEKMDDERATKILDMWLAYYTQEEIAGTVGLGQSRVAQILNSIRKLYLQETNTPLSLQTFNIWNFHQCDKQYGMKYPGRIPGQIVENVLHYYTEPFDTVVDPMAGGGTTLDVCKAMYRRYRCYDISPVRADISQHDVVTDGFPCSGANLVFLDPPYWKQKQGSYSSDETNLANMPLDEFYAAIDTILDNARNALVDDGYVAVIMGPTQSAGKIYDHAFEITKMLEQYFSFVHRIIVPYSTQVHGGNFVKIAQQNKELLYLYRDLMIFRKTG